jgi:hypothetical protein
VSNSRNNNVVVIVGAVVFCFVIAAVVAIYVAAPEGANTGSLITLLIGQVAPTLVALGVLAKVNSTAAQVEQVAEDTYRLTNGLLDAKARAAIADTMPEHLLDPDYVDGQMHADRRVRDQQHDREPRRPDLDDGTAT